MNRFYDIFGIRAPDPEGVTGVSLAFHGAPAWVVVAGLLLAAGLVWFYARSLAAFPRTRRTVLLVLRAALLILILVMMLRPVLLFSLEGIVRQQLVVLIDNSASMQIRDQRRDEQDLRRVGLVDGRLDPRKGLAQPVPKIEGEMPARSALVASALSNPVLDLARRIAEHSDVDVWSFASEISRVAADPAVGPTWTKDLAFDGKTSAPGDAVAQILDRKRGQSLGGILLITDGAANRGMPLGQAAALAQQAGVPLHVYGVGIENPVDLAIRAIHLPDLAFVDEETEVRVTVQARNLTGRRFTLGLTSKGRKLGEQSFEAAATGEQQVAVRIKPDKAGDWDLEASLPVVGEELVRENNTARATLAVSDRKVRVLLLETLPRWENRFLLSMLQRDRRMDAKIHLLDGDADLVEGPDSIYLKDLPKERKDLFAYDVVIVGEVDPVRLGPAMQQTLVELVSERSGGVIFLSGPEFNPAKMGAAVLGRLLPVEAEDVKAPWSTLTKLQPVRLTPEGRDSLLLRLSPDAEQNEKDWESFPGFFWSAPALRTRPAAELLATVQIPGVREGSGTRPLLAAQNYGSGRVLYIGTDELWRLRRGRGEAWHTRLWNQMVTHAASKRLRNASARIQLAPEKTLYVTGERVVVSGRVFDKDLEPVRDRSLRAVLAIQPSATGSAAVRREVVLQADGAQPGFFRAEFPAEVDGDYRLTLDNESVSFRSWTPDEELAATAMEREILLEATRASGGTFFREENLADLPGAVRSEARRLPSPVTVDVIHSPWLFVLLVLAASTEWFLRRRWQLK
jgi:hypothetical protein